MLFSDMTFEFVCEMRIDITNNNEDPLFSFFLSLIFEKFVTDTRQESRFFDELRDDYAIARDCNCIIGNKFACHGKYTEKLQVTVV